MDNWRIEKLSENRTIEMTHRTLLGRREAQIYNCAIPNPVLFD